MSNIPLSLSDDEQHLYFIVKGKKHYIESNREPHFSNGTTDSVSRLKVKLLAKETLGIPSVMAVPPTITAGVSNGVPVTATVRVIPWAGGTQVNNLLNSPHFWVYNSANIVGERRVSGVGATSAFENFDYVGPVMPTAPGTGVAMCIHFIFDGPVFEVQTLVNGRITMLVNGQLVSAAPYVTAGTESWIKFDFGTRATRYISLYSVGRIGSLSIGLNDSISPWDRSKDINAVFHADSYGELATPNLHKGGPAADAFLRLGVASWWGAGHGSTGYYATYDSGGILNKNAVDAFPHVGAVDLCDLWLTSLGINENRSSIGAAIYDAQVFNYYQLIRAKFPDAVIAATGPWAPAESSALTAARIDISASVLAQLRKISGPWVFMDNLTGNWYNSAGATGRNKNASTSSTTTVAGGPSINTLAQSPVQSGTWQTGEGWVGAATGRGNGDLYLGDNLHANAAGSSYLGSRIAHDLRQAILNL